MACVPLANADADNIADAVLFAAGDALPWRVTSEGGPVLAQAAQAADGSLLLHVVDWSGSAFARGLQCAVECDKQPQRVLPCVPGRDPAPLTFLTWDNGCAQFSVGGEVTAGDVPRYLLLQITF